MAFVESHKYDIDKDRSLVIAHSEGWHYVRLDNRLIGRSHVMHTTEDAAEAARFFDKVVEAYEELTF